MNKFCNTLLAGIVIGFLIAPDKGSNTRKNIARKIQSLRDRFQCSEETGNAMARDSGLSRRVSPDMADDV